MTPRMPFPFFSYSIEMVVLLPTHNHSIAVDGNYDFPNCVSYFENIKVLTTSVYGKDIMTRAMLCSRMPVVLGSLERTNQGALSLFL